jgi:nitroreductase
MRTVMDVIKRRRSVRKYQSRDVEAHKLEQMLQAAMLAPSGLNSQPWYFVVVRDEEVIQEISQANRRQAWIATAPVCIACVADIRVRGSFPKSFRVDDNTPDPELKKVIRDTAIAVEHMVLVAEEMGLATCWTGWYEQKEMRPLLGIPDDKYVVCVLTVGYPDQSPPARPRDDLYDRVFYDFWGIKGGDKGAGRAIPGIRRAGLLSQGSAGEMEEFAPEEDVL